MKEPSAPSKMWALFVGLILFIEAGACRVGAQVTTTGFLNLPRTESPGTLLSHPLDNDSEAIGRTTSLNYLNGWLIVGGEIPGSRSGSDLLMRVYDVADPANPVRRFPSDFGLNYPDNRWHEGNVGWNAHGTAQYGPLLLPQVMRVTSFGGVPELGGTNGIPRLGMVPVGHNRSNMAGPWGSTLLWYGTPDQDFKISRASTGPYGYTIFQSFGTFDHVGQYGGGDWHPIIFGDLLIYVRSGTATRDGIVVYRLLYENFDDGNPSNDRITPQLVSSLPGGFQGYWPNLFSDGSGLYVIGSTTDVLVGVDITQAAEVGGDDSVTTIANLPIPGFNNSSYPTYQDHFAFIDGRKINMTRFLAGDANPIVLTLDEVGERVDTSQMSLALGNLWITGGFPITGLNQGMGIWVHQQEPDTTAPRVTYHIPQPNRVNYPRFAPLSFLVHEHTRAGGPRNGIDFSVRRVLSNGTFGSVVPGFLLHDFAGTLTFTPDDYLDADATYQVDFIVDPQNEIGFRDASGNYIEPYSFRFSTGGGIDATPPPNLTSLTASNYQPAPGETITVNATATGESALEYRFNFDGTWSPWTANNSGTHSYSEAGRPRVLVQVRDTEENLVTDSLSLLVIEPLTSSLRPTQSSSMAIGDDSGVRQLWVVNPDANTVGVLNAETGAYLAEYEVGANPRSIARDANGRYWVTCYQSDEIYILNQDGSIFQVLTLDYGVGPFGILSSPDGTSLFVSLYNSSQILRYDASNPSNPIVTNTPFPTPRALAMNSQGTRLFVTRFISNGLDSEIAEFATDGNNLSLSRTIHLSSSNTADRGDRAAGGPNYLAGIAISPDDSRAVVVSKQDNIQRGELYGINDLTHETTVRAVISLIDLNSNQEIRHTRRDFDNSDSPSAVTFSPLGDSVFVTLQGNNTVVAMDILGLNPASTANVPGSTQTSPAVEKAVLETGFAPQGVLLDPVSQRLYSQDFMGRSVTVRDASLFLDNNLTSFPSISTTSSVSNEPLSSEVLLGKQIFYNAADPRMSADSYISCASCHVDGGSDGRVWDFTGRGEGLRRTTDLRGRSGLGHGNVHWSGNFDEIQDFEHDIREAFGGEGFLNLNATQFNQQHPSPASTKAGLSSELDALAAYVTSLGYAEIPRSPHRNSDGSMTAAALRGRDLFEAQSCVTCHQGDALTNSQITLVGNPLLTDLGSLSLFSGSRLGQNLAGIDTPTLQGIHTNSSYLHHGLAETLQDVFSYAGGTTLTLADVSTFHATETDDPAEGGGGFIRGIVTGTLIHLDNSNQTLRLDNVDGGTGGAGRVAIRYLRRFGNTTAQLRVNGTTHPLNLLIQFPDNFWQQSGWRWVTVDVSLQPGTDNTIELIRSNQDFAVDSLTVSNAQDLANAEPHRRVLSLSAGQQSDLIAYLLQLDGHTPDGQLLADPFSQLRQAYSDWIATYASVLGPDELAFGDDPDQDGLLNIEEYLFGGDPTNPSPLEIPQIIEQNGKLHYQIVLNRETEGWRVHVESSEDLVNWEILATSENGSELSGEGTLQVISEEPHTTVVKDEDETAPQRFYRTRAEPTEAN